MDFLQFIFSNFWAWLGFIVLMLFAMSGILQVVKCLPKTGRRITVHKFGDKWYFTIDNANDMDVIAVFREIERQDRTRLWTIKEKNDRGDEK